MLKVKNLQKSFGGIKALDGLSFEIEPNKITALIGPNGAGKTTLFDVISGFVSLDDGAVYLDNKNINNLTSYKRAKLGISRIFQQVRLFKNLKVIDHLHMAESSDDDKLFKNIFKRKKIERQKYLKLLKEFGLEEKIDELISSLSYGQRKLVQIACSLIQPHKLLLLDEPVAGVNSVIQEKIENFLLNLKNTDETVLLIDHDMKFVKKLADKIIVLSSGKKIAEGSAEEVFKDKRVIDAYLGK